MSSIASFYLLNARKLDALLNNAPISIKKTLFSKKITDNYYNWLAENSMALTGFDGPGHLYGNLFIYLEENKNIALLHNEYDHLVDDLTEKRGIAHFIFTIRQKILYAEQLSPHNFSLADIQAFNKDFSDEGDEDTAQLMLEAVSLLRDNLAMIEDGQQVLLMVAG